MACASAEGDERALKAVRDADYYKVRVLASGLEPEELRVIGPQAAFLVVANETDSLCEFYLGPFVQGLRVEPHDSANIGFTIVEIEGGESSMGCADRLQGGTVKVIAPTTPALLR
jgi:hypothetical protein